MSFFLNPSYFILLDLCSCLLCPSLERNLEIHHCQEWIDTVFFLYEGMLNVVVSKLEVAFFLDFKCHKIYTMLRKKLKNLHLLIDLHISVLTSHASIKQLVEVYIPVVTLNSHFKHLFFELTFFIVLAKSKRSGLVSIFTQNPEELWKLLLFNFEALIFVLRFSFPNPHKAVKISFEKNNHVIFW